MNEAPSQQIVEQRLRNRVLEYLEGVLEYEDNPGAWSMSDVVNEWQMCVEDPFTPAAFPAPVYTPAEIEALAVVHAAWLAFANATPKDITDAALSLPEWSALLGACSTAAAEFRHRGKQPEENAIP